MRVVLTSFRDKGNWLGQKFSIARWNPRDSQFIPRLTFLAPMIDGKPIIHLPPVAYEWQYRKVLDKAEPHLEDFLRDANDLYDEVVLLCWCNLDRQKNYPTLYCHRILVGYWLEVHYPQVGVIYADGAEKPVWPRD